MTRSAWVAASRASPRESKSQSRLDPYKPCLFVLDGFLVLPADSFAC